jgi:hypothetical protein
MQSAHFLVKQPLKNDLKVAASLASLPSGACGVSKEERSGTAGVPDLSSRMGWGGA